MNSPRAAVPFTRELAPMSASNSGYDPREHWPLLTASALIVLSALTSYPTPGTVISLGLLALSVAIARWQPTWAFGVLWLSGLTNLVFVNTISAVHVFAAVPLFCIARYGSRAALWVSGLSLVPAVVLATYGTWFQFGYYDASLAFPISGGLGRFLPNGSGFFVIALGIVVPWVVGAFMRLGATADEDRQLREAAETERTEAVELAALREEQARLARDVHDVVGHSLAVILAQAESAAYLPEDDPEKFKEVMANIATTARKSLTDVRQVLRPDETPATSSYLSLDGLAHDLATAGRELHRTTVGSPRPLSPERAAVADRTLQEMLTNALRHGDPTTPIRVTDDWTDDLVIEVSNHVGEQPVSAPGHGLRGMESRLASIGGRLETQVSEGRFVAHATIPTSAPAAWIQEQRA